MPPRPTYTQQIIDDITSRIRSGTWPPGHRLPTIDQLAVEYGCSIQPVRAALRDLQTLGLIEGHKGVGNFVAGG